MANLAGSIDMVFKNVDDDTYSIYDWKRTKEIKKYGFGKKGKYSMHNYHDCNFTHYSLQLNIYKYILEKYYGIKIRDMFLICMHPTYVTYQKYQTLDLQEEVTIIMSARENFQLKEPEVEANEVEENEVEENEWKQTKVEANGKLEQTKVEANESGSTKKNFLNKMMSLSATRDTVRAKINASVGDDAMTANIEKSIYKYTTSHAKDMKIPLLWSNVNLRRIYTRKSRSVLFNVLKSKVLSKIKKSKPKTPLSRPVTTFVRTSTSPFSNASNRGKIMTMLVDKEDEDEYESPLACPDCGSKNTRAYTMYQCRSGGRGQQHLFLGVWLVDRTT